MPVSLTFSTDPADGYDVIERLFLASAEPSCFSSLIVDGPGGLLANMDVAADALGRSAANIVLTYWPGVIEPQVAAPQLGFLQTLSRGRLSLRIILPDHPPLDSRGHARRHVGALQELGAHIKVLDAVWDRDRLDGCERPALRLRGATGAALRLAARHAHIFELPAGDTALLLSVIERLDAARAQLGRRDRIRLALPVRISPRAAGGIGRLDLMGTELVYQGPISQLASVLRPYIAIGIDEVVIGGPTQQPELVRFEEEAAPALLALDHRPAKEFRDPRRRTPTGKIVAATASH